MPVFTRYFVPVLRKLQVGLILKDKVFAVFQLMAAISKEPERWFFLVGLIRLMEVPADIAYGILVKGATATSQMMIFIAPVMNCIIGIYLLLLSEKLKKERLSKVMK